MDKANRQFTSAAHIFGWQISFWCLVGVSLYARNFDWPNGTWRQFDIPQEMPKINKCLCVCVLCDVFMHVFILVLK